MIESKLTTRTGEATSLQVSNLVNIPTGKDYTPEHAFLLKLLDSDSQQVTVKMLNSNDWITTSLQPGWNPEIVKAVQSPSVDLQAGY